MRIAKIILGAWLLAPVGSASAQDGKAVFNTFCISCHTIGKGQVVGPDLKGAHTRHKDKWLKKWIKSSQTMVQEKDPEAAALFSKYNMIVMPDAPISDAEIVAVIAYIKAESGTDATPAATEAKTSPATGQTVPGTTVSGTGSLISGKEFFSTLWISLIAIFFLGILAVMAKVIFSLSAALNDKYESKS